MHNKNWIEQLYNSTQIGILVVDKERNNLFVNTHLCKMFDYKEEFLLQQSAEIFHVNHTSFLEFADLAFNAVSAGTPLGIDYEFKRKDGSYFWAHISGDPIKNEKGVLWTLVDISQRVLAQEEANYRYKMLDTVINTTPDLIFYKDYVKEDGKYIGCNNAFTTFVGKSKEELIGKTDIELFGKEVGQFFRSKDKEMLTKGETVINEEWVDYPNGEKVLLNTSKTPLHNPNNEAIGILGISRDITDIYNSNEHIKKLSERMELALLGNNDGIWDWNLQTDEVYYSPRWKEMLGYKDDELANKFSVWEEHVHPEDKEMVLEKVQSNIDGKSDYVDVYHRLRHKDGHWVWIHNRSKTIYNDNAQAIRMIGTHTDASIQKAIELKYAQQAQMIEQTHDSVISTDIIGTIKSFNHGSELLLEYKANEIIGKNIQNLYLKEDYKSLAHNIELLKQDGECNTEVRLVKKSAKIVDADLSLSLLKDDKGKAIGIVAYSQDITIRKKAQMALDHQAHYDALTELPNRVLFRDRLEQAIEKGKRDGSKFALLFIDLDHFKEINDSLGHGTGDNVLRIVTARLQEALREKDTIARLGGDEFTVILEDLSVIHDASVIAMKILETLAKEIKINKQTLYVSSSIGISIYPDDGNSSQDLLKFADSAMYKAKDAGRNNFQFYDTTLTEQAFERVIMGTSLRTALKEEQFVVYYHPQVDGNKNELIGMEALVRWRHPSLGIVPPANFIPLAETIGLIVQLDKYVMKTAMTQVASWYKEGLNPGKLALNLAVKQLQQKDFIDMLKNLMQETGIKAEWLELEVTESQVMSNPEEAIQILNQISDLGIDLAVDDFGTGYSSLAYLKRLPINKLKIDQGFVRDLPDDEEDAGITKAVIALAKSLNLHVIAEGVETKEQKDFIVENGCENIQGYFYSQPIPANELRLLLKNGFRH